MKTPTLILLLVGGGLAAMDAISREWCPGGVCLRTPGIEEPAEIKTDQVPAEDSVEPVRSGR